MTQLNFSATFWRHTKSPLEINCFLYTCIHTYLLIVFPKGLFTEHYFSRRGVEIRALNYAKVSLNAESLLNAQPIKASVQTPSISKLYLFKLNCDIGLDS